MISGWEISANVLNASSIVLAGRNSIHTWWVGILGCAAFVYVYLQARLYADVTLQCFFIGTSVVGWWNWVPAREGAGLGVSSIAPRRMAAHAAAAAGVALAYGWLLRRFTDAYAPFWDSTILAFSVLGQFLLMKRKIETWWCWLVVNSIAVPLYLTRGLRLTALLYAGFWLNAVVSLVRWRRLLSSPAR